MTAVKVATRPAYMLVGLASWLICLALFAADRSTISLVLFLVATALQAAAVLGWRAERRRV